MISVCAENLTEKLEELKAHFPSHWDELALNKDKVPLDPNYDIYLARDALGEVLLVTARERGLIVAYFVGFIAPALHYQSCITLTMDIFWLHPDIRDGDSLTGVERDMACELLFECVKREAVRRGVQRVFYGSKVHKDASAMFERMGMVEVERYYSAWWGE